MAKTLMTVGVFYLSLIHICAVSVRKPFWGRGREGTSGPSGLVLSNGRCRVSGEGRKCCNVRRFSKTQQEAKIHAGSINGRGGPAFKRPCFLGGLKHLKRLDVYKRQDKERYPEDTSLRRAAKQYLMKGNDVGIGIGVIDVPYKNI